MAELECTLSVHEFNEWRAYDSLDPIGGYRGDIQAALVAASMSGGKLSDYLIIDPNPTTDDERDAQQAREEVARMIAMFNGA